jgi:hypothetical protein
LIGIELNKKQNPKINIGKIKCPLTTSVLHVILPFMIKSRFAAFVIKQVNIQNNYGRRITPKIRCYEGNILKK